jgi:hypothetical protein
VHIGAQRRSHHVAIAAVFIATFKEFPPRQKPQTFNLDQVMQRLEKPSND